MQIVLMSLKQGESIPREIHNDTDQLFYVVRGRMSITMGSTVHRLGRNDSFIVNMKRYHTVKNIGRSTLKFFTVYSPPHHRKGLRQKRQGPRLW